MRTSASLGCPAVTISVLFISCITVNTANENIILPYDTQYGISLSPAPRTLDIGSMKIPNMTEKKIPAAVAAKVIKVNADLASSFLPSPSLLPMTALPPLPNITPSPYIK